MKAEVDAVVARQQARVAEWEAAVSEEESALAAKHNTLQVGCCASTELHCFTMIALSHLTHFPSDGVKGHTLGLHNVGLVMHSVCTCIC